MSSVSVVGGVYHERCVWPQWDHVYGSAGRAAVVLSNRADKVEIHTYAKPDVAKTFEELTARPNRIELHSTEGEEIVTFDYMHSMSMPSIFPNPIDILKNPPLKLKKKTILRFGMLEGTAIVDADYCVYDPQSAFAPEPFGENGSKARHLAIVANKYEIMSMGESENLSQCARVLLDRGAEVVVVKSGVKGIEVFEKSGTCKIPAFQTEHIWAIGSGDVFSAIFAAKWAICGLSPVEAAYFASYGVSDYVSYMSVPVAALNKKSEFKRPEAVFTSKKVYIAGPFFTMSQRWMIEESCRALRDLGCQVLSPIHEVGRGPANQVASADIQLLEEADIVFAVLDGLDSGTIFEVGYARAKNKPVYALAEAVPNEDLKMVEGSQCKIFNDFVTAVHCVAWHR